MTTRSLRVEHADDTREALIRAAQDLFAAHGYSGTGIEQIAAHARVTSGALYHHFHSKAALFEAVVGLVADELYERLVAGALSQPSQDLSSAFEQLRVGMQVYLDACLAPDFVQIVLIDGPAVVGHLAWDRLVSHRGGALLQQWLQTSIDETLIEPLPVEALAHILGTLVGQASLYIAHADDPATARRDTGVVLDRLLGGLLTGAGGPSSTGKPAGREGCSF